MTRLITHTTTGRYSGAMTALITPFKNGEIDEISLCRLVDMQIEAGINGLVPCGTTGESVTMTEDEQARVISLVIEQTVGRVPVIAGTGSNSTRVTIERTRQARAAGANAALIVAPYYNKPTQEGLYAHYAAIADAVDLPIVLYNVPGRTAVQMQPETIMRLSEIPTVVAIKEACGNLDQVSELVTRAPEGFAILSGDDSLTLPIMSVGGVGVISVVSNIAPAAVAELTSRALAGDMLGAREIHLQMFDLCRSMFLDNNPTAVKTAAAMEGICSDEVRLPLTSISVSSKAAIEAALRAWRSVRLGELTAA
jgi:4-hydroxy-tetrahydrodipicolinate synthase